MAEQDFEARLARLYAEPPLLADAERFVAGVTVRLDRGWTLRRWAIGAAGGAAGLVAAGQIVTARFTTDLRAVSETGARGLNLGVDEMLGTVHRMLETPSSSETLWLAVALAVLALGFALTRMMEEF